MSRISESSSFAGKNLLNGDLSGDGALAIVDGSEGEAVEVDVESQSAGDLGVEGLDVADASTLAAIDRAIDSVSSTRASLGTLENRLSVQVSVLSVKHENVAAANSRIVDTDYARETASHVRFSIQEQMAMAVAGQANTSMRVALKLLHSG